MRLWQFSSISLVIQTLPWILAVTRRRWRKSSVSLKLSRAPHSERYCQEWRNTAAEFGRKECLLGRKGVAPDVVVTKGRR